MRLITAVAVVVALTSCSKNPGEVCFERIKPKFKDPTTATLVRWQQDGERLGTAVEVRASNSYGGFALSWARCQPEGVVWYKSASEALFRN